MPENAKKKCAICGEEINAIAVKCIHCGEFLEGHTGWSLSNWFGLKHKSLWDVMSLLFIPIILLGMGYFLDRFETDRQASIKTAEASTSTSIAKAANATQAAEATVNAAKTGEAIRDAKATEAIRATEAAEAIRVTEASATAAAIRTAEALATGDAVNAQAAIAAAQAEGIAIAEAQDKATAEAKSAEATINAAKTAEAIRDAQVLATAKAAEVIRATQAAEAIRAAEATATAEAKFAAEAVATIDAINSQATIAAAQAAEKATAEAMATAEANNVEATKNAALAAEQLATAEAASTAQAVNATATAKACSYKGTVKDPWERYKERLGCPKETQYPPYAWQPFENGLVFWSGALERLVIANNDGSWRSVGESQIPDPNCPEEYPLLKGAIRRLWCPPFNAGQNLRFPLEAEKGDGIAFQDFDNGFIWRDEANKVDYIFFSQNEPYTREEY